MKITIMITAFPTNCPTVHFLKERTGQSMEHGKGGNEARRAAHREKGRIQIFVFFLQLLGWKVQGISK